MTQRTMIVLDAGASRFQLRAAALIRHGSHILIHRAVSDPFWALPDGRVEFHESGAQTLAREIEEEIGRSATMGDLRLIIENFFDLNGISCHEIGLCYDAALDQPLPFSATDIVHRSRDGQTDLEFRWVPAEAAALRTFDLKPALLIDLIPDLPEGLIHRIYRD